MIGLPHHAWFRRTKTSSEYSEFDRKCQQLFLSIELFVKQAVAHALIADDHLLRMKESHDRLDQASAGKDHVGPLGLQAGNLFALGDGLVVKKTHLAPHVHRVVVFEHRTALVGEIADGIVHVSATAPPPVGAQGARGVGNPV